MLGVAGVYVPTPPVTTTEPVAKLIVVAVPLDVPFCSSVTPELNPLITPSLMVIVVPSGLTRPYCAVVASCIAGAASERIKVSALPLIAVGPAVAVGFAPDTPPELLITPSLIVIVVPSGLTRPKILVVATGTEINPEVTWIVVPSGFSKPGWVVDPI